MDVLACRVCEAAGAFSRFGKLFVLAAGAMFVSEEARCAFTSRCCCCPSRQRRRKANYFLQLAHRKDFLHKQGVFRKEGETLSGERDQRNTLKCRQPPKEEVVNQRPDGLQLVRSAEVTRWLHGYSIMDGQTASRVERAGVERMPRC